MPKCKRPRALHRGRRDGPFRLSQRGRTGRLDREMRTVTNPNGGNQCKTQQKQHQRPIIPFNKTDRILLVGEGDFSFSRSLAKHHHCRYIVATCYDSKDVLFEKYPQARENINELLRAFPSKQGVEPGAVTEALNDERKGNKDETELIDRAEEIQKGDDVEAQGPHNLNPRPPIALFSIDAKKLGTPAGGGREIRNGLPQKRVCRYSKRPQHRVNEYGSNKGAWDVIAFNFPHVGGLSTDVNRQVRANQELLVAFFKTCIPLLSNSPTHDTDDNDFKDCNDYTESECGSDIEAEDDDSKVTAKKTVRTGPGQVLVTLFEGEPYTLWNIRDLARHAGLRVVTSFRFPWNCYPGYSHARTLGVIEGQHGGKGGWRGEDREARTYVFEVKEEERGNLPKRTRAEDSEESD